MSSCVSGRYLRHFTLHTLHLTLYTLDSTLYTPRSTLYTLHFALYTWHSTLDTLHLPLHTVHFTRICALDWAFRNRSSLLFSWSDLLDLSDLPEVGPQAFMAALTDEQRVHFQQLNTEEERISYPRADHHK